MDIGGEGLVMPQIFLLAPSSRQKPKFRIPYRYECLEAVIVVACIRLD